MGRELLEEELGLLEELEEGLLEDELLEELLAVPLEVPLWPAEELAELEVAAEEEPVPEEEALEWLETDALSSLLLSGEATEVPESKFLE